MGIDPSEKALGQLLETLDGLKQQKPNDRSELDRRYAIIITELEKVIAYLYTFVLHEGEV